MHRNRMTLLWTLVRSLHCQGGMGRTSMLATSTAVLGMPRLLAAECFRKDAMDTAKILKKWYMPSPRKTATAKNTCRKTETTNQSPQTVSELDTHTHH